LIVTQSKDKTISDARGSGAIKAPGITESLLDLMKDMGVQCGCLALQGGEPELRTMIQCVEQGRPVLTVAGLGGASSYMAAAFRAEQIRRSAKGKKKIKVQKKAQKNTTAGSTAVASTLDIVGRPSSLNRVDWSVPTTAKWNFCLLIDAINLSAHDIRAQVKALKDNDNIITEHEVSEGEQHQLINAWEEHVHCEQCTPLSYHPL
jgi:hypothetical protein